MAAAKRLLLLAAFAGFLCFPASASAATFAPPAGSVLHGGTGGYSAGHIHDFGALSGRKPAVYQYFFTPTWNADRRSLNWQAGLLRMSEREGVRAMFHLSTA